MSTEKQRLAEIKEHREEWQRWGPYLSERSWGTVREDYSAEGAAWNHLTHDMARSKTYRWGEDGLAGICDRYQVLCSALALWNGRDPILKERPFGLIPSEGNHGEDLKEYYFYVDSTPTHSYMKYLYKYPQAEYPYQRLIDENRNRGGTGPEFELLDTGIFDEDRYFDVFVEYAKAGPEDICIRIEAFNRGPQEAELHLLPHLWFRNIWAWEAVRRNEPLITRGPSGKGFVSLIADDSAADGLDNLPFDYKVGRRILYGEADGKPLFTDNESNLLKLYGPAADDGRRYVKDAFHRQVVNGEAAVNEEEMGTKACLHYVRKIAAGESTVVRLRLCPEEMKSPLAEVDRIVATRLREADEFYDAIHPRGASEDERRVQRQAFAGLMWSKQNYIFDVDRWLDGDNPDLPPPASRHHMRNKHWRHLNSMRVLSMPDKWEYPWFAAWDLAFHTIAIALVDSEFAKEQLWFMLFEQFQHPNGQIPAYEWEFSDLNPPVHPWAVWRVYNMDRIRSGKADRAFLEKCFHKLLINFAWWINKVDSSGNNIFEGGFLGLDNITLFDRSREAARRRDAGAVRRDGVDGSLLSQHDAHRPGARAGKPHLRGARDEVLPALCLRGRRDEAHGRARPQPVGRGGRVLLRRPALSRRHLRQAAGALDGGAHSPLRGRASRERLDRAIRRIHHQPQLVPGEPQGPGEGVRQPHRARGPGDVRPHHRQPRPATAHAPSHVRPGRIPVRLRPSQPLEGASGKPLRPRPQPGGVRAG